MDTGVMHAVAVHSTDTVRSLRQQVAAREGQPVRALLCDGKPLLNERATLREVQVTSGAVLYVTPRGLAGGAKKLQSASRASKTSGKRHAEADDSLSAKKHHPLSGGTCRPEHGDPQFV